MSQQDASLAAAGEPGRGPRWQRWVLAAVVLGTVALRTWDAAREPDARRNFDERFSLRNVHRILVEGELRPAHAFYPSLATLPQTAVLATSEGLHRLTRISWLSIYAPTPDGWSATAYRLCRFTNVAWAALTLLLLYRVGRRIFSPTVGLLAAAMLAAFPRHVGSSSVYKPDALTVLLVLLAFDWSLSAAWRPSARGFLRAGAGVGLAAASKYTGASAALSVIVAALARGGWRDPRRWGWLVLAGVASLAVFAALNPWLGMVAAFTRHLVKGYAASGVQEGSDHWVVLRRQGEFLFEHHGPWVTALLLFGLGRMAWRLARPGSPGWDERRRTGALLVLGQFLGYVVLHAAGMSLFRGQNFLPAVPYSALVAAWGAVEAWEWLARRWPALMRPRVAAAAALAAIVLLLLAQGATVYAAAVPTHWRLALHALATELEPPEGRVVLYEQLAGERPLRLTTRDAQPVAVAVPRLAGEPSAERALADAEVGIDAGSRELSAAAQASPELGRARVFATRPFRSQGTPVTVLLHPWARAGAPRPLPLTNTGDAALRAELPPDLATGAVVSFAARCAREAPRPDRVRVAGAELPMVEVRRHRGRTHLATRRVRLDGEETEVLLPLSGRARRARCELEVQRWMPASGTR